MPGICAAIGAGGSLVTGALASLPWGLGFSAGGVVAGSTAAAAQAAVGNVAAGSAFSFLQSVGATTLMGTPVGAAVGVAGAAAFFIIC